MMGEQGEEQYEGDRHTYEVEQDGTHKNLLSTIVLDGPHMVALPPPDGCCKACAEGTNE